MAKLKSMLVCAVAANLAACGIGVQTGVHQASYSEADESGSFVTKGFTIYDKTGILLAAAGTAGSKYNAQRDAEQAAIDRGAKAGDTYSYTYTQYAPVPGNWTYLSYDWGDGEIKDGVTVEFSNFDLRTKLGNWKVMDGKGRIAISLGALWTEYKSNDIAGGENIDHTWIGMPTGVDFGYTISPKMTAAGRLAIDPLIGGLQALLGYDGGFLELGGRYDFRPIKVFSVFADGMMRREPALADDGHVLDFQLTAGLAFIFGDGLIGGK